MGTVRKELTTRASGQAIWSAIQDIGALHTRLAPGFVIDTRLEPGARLVTFANGVTVREAIVTIDETARRLVWGAQGSVTTHYNASVQVFEDQGLASRVVWVADFLPDSAASAIDAAMSAGMAAMQRALDALPPA